MAEKEQGSIAKALAYPFAAGIAGGSIKGVIEKSTERALDKTLAGKKAKKLLKKHPKLRSMAKTLPWSGARGISSGLVGVMYALATAAAMREMKKGKEKKAQADLRPIIDLVYEAQRDRAAHQDS